MLLQAYLCGVKHQRLIEASHKYRGLTSLNKSEYELLLETFDENIREKLRFFTLKGSYRKHPQLKESANSSLLGSRKKLDFILIYLKENPNQMLLGHMYDMSQSKVSEWISFILPVLEESLSVRGFSAIHGYSYAHRLVDTPYLLGDVTERDVPRRSSHSAQKVEYSGKKKRHTHKSFALTDERGYILFLSPSYEGSVHDKRIWDELEIELDSQPLLLDLGFLGADKDSANIILPFKKPKGGEFSKLQKQINQAISRLRVKVEHAFAGVKRLKIIRHKIRLKGYEIRERVMRIAVALHNLRTQARVPVVNDS